MAGISSVDQVENRTPPTSPLYWDSDEDDDGGPKPSELYEKHTWEIKNYSQITKTYLRSKTFEAGGCKWYILFYPQGYDAANNNNSLYLFVLNADKPLPGSSHLVYFKIGVVNKDPEKYHYHDALHRFWKKSDSWGFTEFMELSKLEDGFIDGDTLIIEAHVQLIRKRTDRPFRCLDPQFKKQVISRYLRDVERIFYDFVEERVAKLRKYTEDVSRWSRLCAFWSNVDPASRRRMSLVEMDSILKVIVKHFPIDSIDAVFVMDSMYNGLKALKGQHKGKKSSEAKAVHSHIAEEDLSVHFIRIENDSFVVAEVDDALQLLERAASEPFPPKDEKGRQDRAAVEHRRLTELGRQAIEIFVLEQIFREIEAAVNGTPSSPLCLDSNEDEDEEDDRGPEASELCEKHTWEIKNYSQITKTYLRSKAFEAGGCKWFVEVYPEGYDASNHLSLFLCVANADKLLPWWSHLVYFEIGVVNKDPKKSRYFDGLHRFWKKRCEWGWSQLMELSELEDGFIDDDTLVIEAYVQAIRERADGLFRCLDPHLRGLVVGRYRRDVERIFHDFVEERLAKLRKLTQDVSRWSSFRAFWSSVDPASRRRLSCVEMDSTLKAIVKHFPIDSKVAVFVTDSMYNGLKALKGSQHKEKKSEDKAVHSHIAEEEDLSVHFIRIEKDSFILMEVNDALQLLKRAASDEKGPQLFEDGAAAKELNEESIESHERRLTESGRQAIEMFVLSQIFSKIEAAYEEDVAFKAGC